MNYDIYIYLISTLFASFALSGINYEKLMKSNRFYESRILVVLLSIVIGYIVTQFILVFI